MLLQKFVNLNFKLHLLISFSIRLLMITYGVYHDGISDVKYTDIDYKVFTDASRHILSGNSPYDRHTYRYSPLVAISLIPNILLHHTFGKILFCLVDILVAILIRQIVKNNLKEYECHKQKLNKTTQKQISYLKLHNKSMVAKYGSDWWADISMLSWLYNPMTIAIGTRGNCDSLACFFVLLTLYFLQCRRNYFVAGITHGIAVHFRLYPIIYSLSYFMFLSKFSFYSTEDKRTEKKNIGKGVKNKKHLKNFENNLMASLKNENVAPFSKVSAQSKKTIFKKQYLLYLVPNFDQIKLISGCLLSLTSLTVLFYYLYGYKFLYETYIYHLIRKDPRHNFSLYFYLQYLTAWVKNIGLWQKVLMVLPQIVLLLVFSIRYGLNRFSLNFSVLTQTVVMVIYNSVLTSQYFVWVMGVLPLCLWQIKMPKKTAGYLIAIWFLAQVAWLLPAYLLEFRGKNTFLFIWIQGVSFFCANIAVLGRLIASFMPFVGEKSKLE